MPKVALFKTDDKYIIGTREGRSWWYIKSFHNGNFTFTGNKDAAEAYSLEKAHELLEFGGCNPQKTVIY